MLDSWFSEALLEMHFHKKLIEYYTSIFGANYLGFYKPTPSKEAWVGFDQAFVRTDLGANEFYSHLKNSISTSQKSVNKFYIGYFLQFKPVIKYVRKSTRMPASFTTPYYRSELSLEPNKITKISQHETLLRLNNIHNSIVYYACGMLFSQSEIFEEANLNNLRLVDINTAPSGWITNQKHSISFQDIHSEPVWCSEPVEGKAYFVEDVFNKRNEGLILNSSQAIELIQESTNILSPDKTIKEDTIESLNSKYIPDCFTLIELTKDPISSPILQPNTIDSFYF